MYRFASSPSSSSEGDGDHSSSAVMESSHTFGTLANLAAASSVEPARYRCTAVLAMYRSRSCSGVHPGPSNAFS